MFNVKFIDISNSTSEIMPGIKLITAIQTKLHSTNDTINRNRVCHERNQP